MSSRSEEKGRHAIRHRKPSYVLRGYSKRKGGGGPGATKKEMDFLSGKESKLEQSLRALGGGVAKGTRGQRVILLGRGERIYQRQRGGVRERGGENSLPTGIIVWEGNGFKGKRGCC